MKLLIIGIQESQKRLEAYDIKTVASCSGFVALLTSRNQPHAQGKGREGGKHNKRKKNRYARDFFFIDVIFKGFRDVLVMGRTVGFPFMVFHCL